MRHLNKLPLYIVALLLIAAAAACRKSSPVDRLLDDVSRLSADSVVDYSKLQGRYDDSDLKYKLTDDDRHRLIDSLGQWLIESYKEYVQELRKECGTDSIPTGLIKAHLADDLDKIVKQVNACQTFGELRLVVSDMNGTDTWKLKADFLPKLSEEEVVEQYIQFYHDEWNVEKLDGDSWPLAKCHRAFHNAVLDNISISEPSRRKIINEVSKSELKKLNKQKAEMGDLVEFVSESELRQQVENEFKNCKKFKDLPGLWFLEEPLSPL
ncbi:MAG: hypothetical protein ACI30N_04265 [Muribaculaceae bacterium]